MVPAGKFKSFMAAIMTWEIWVVCICEQTRCFKYIGFCNNIRIITTKEYFYLS
jgi:hypothetical protein